MTHSTRTYRKKHRLLIVALVRMANTAEGKNYGGEGGANKKHDPVHNPGYLRGGRTC